MDSLQMPSKPVITSQLAADAIIEAWNEENAARTLKDHEGMSWDIDVSTEQEIVEAKQGQEIWQVTLRLTCDASAGDLVSAGVLHEEEDLRVIEILGEAKVPLAQKPRVFRVKSLEEAKNLSLDQLAQLEKQLAATPLLEAKRDLVFRHIDASCQFGSHEGRL